VDNWRSKTLPLSIELMKKTAGMLRRRRPPLLLNWFRTRKQFSAGILKGFTAKAKDHQKNAVDTLSILHLAL